MPTPEAGPLDRLLPADAGLRDNTGVDAADRRAASAVSLCRGAHATRSLAAGRPRHWTAPGGHADAQDGA